MISTTHIHPMLVHFPIALVVFGFIADISFLFFKKEACLSRAGFYLLLSGTIMAVFAYFSGVLFTSEMSGAAGEIKEKHELFALITLIALLITSILRIFLMVKNRELSNLKWFVFILYGISTISVSVTGFYGGTLVYSYMMPL